MPDLDDVYAAIQADPYWEHLRKPGINFTPGFGATRPKVLLVGEAPGATENNARRPFAGPSGAVLSQLLVLAGLRLTPIAGGEIHEELPDLEPNAFVTNVVKYRPPGNATPPLSDILHARDGYRQRRAGSFGQDGPVDDGSGLQPGDGSLRQEWAALGGPRLIVCVGGVAHSCLSPMNWEPLGRWVGFPLAAVGADGKRVHGYWVVSQYHPAYGLRQPRNAAGDRVRERMEESWEKMGVWMREEGLL